MNFGLSNWRLSDFLEIFRLYSLIPLLSLLLLSCLVEVSLAQTIPNSANAGLIDKALRQSQPQSLPPRQDEIPEVVISKETSKIDPSAGPEFEVKEIVVEGATVITEQAIANIVQLKEATLMTLGALQLIAQRITALYAEKGYFLSRAYIPAQKLSGGRVVIKVLEGRIGTVSVSGNESILSEQLKNYFDSVMDEKVLNESTLEEALLEVNDLMGVRVRSVLKPNDVPGTSQLGLEVKESSDLSFSIDGDNFGSRFTGRQRVGVSLIKGNLLVLGDQFSFRGIRSDLDQKFGAASYRIPLSNKGTELRLAYAFSNNKLGDTLNNLNAGGNSSIMDLEINQLLFRNRQSRFWMTAGFHRRNFENFTQGLTSSDDKIRAFSLSLGGRMQDSFYGQTFGQIRLNKGLGLKNKNRPLTSRVGGRGDALRLEGNFTRYQNLGIANSYVIIRGLGQVSAIRVLSPDQFSIGGMGTVRGFPLSEFSGDHGYAGSLEFVTPFPFKWKSGLGPLTLDRIISLSAFLDHGKVFTEDRLPGEQDQAITGAGYSVRLTIPKEKEDGPSLNFTASYGIPLPGPRPTDQSNGIVYLSGSLNY
ncbi:MAG: hypothetical protein COV66_11890 [Nitrospinae bacterium CG11_big_fil_rev_8_21_14_0_20_45_15]|nr:MAG: hypothetical protein COV66_11890 [Nitrospinae bacterium CG11_big_fil_rev_8_21_14_0_20_45_15]